MEKNPDYLRLCTRVTRSYHVTYWDVCLNIKLAQDVEFSQGCGPFEIKIWK